MTLYEYDVVITKKTGKNLEDFLNRYGVAGWKLCAATPEKNFLATKTELIFVREIKEAKTIKNDKKQLPQSINIDRKL